MSGFAERRVGWLADLRLRERRCGCGAGLSSTRMMLNDMGEWQRHRICTMHNYD